MKTLSRIALVSCLTIIVSHSVFASDLKCTEIFLSSEPKGKLTLVWRSGGGSTGGRWYADENGVNWFLKQDVHYSELQTSAEPISAKIYQHFGYRAPETAKVIIDGVHYSASRDIGDNNSSTGFSEMNTPEIRQLRVVAAYLKDWDRLGNSANNRKMIDGSVVILDFGGTLGARARGYHKPGAIFSEAIGTFEPTTDIKTIYSSFDVESHTLPEHPWRQINRADAEAVIEKFRLLTDDKIESIVDSAQYSKKSDRDFMIHALETRRDGIIANLLSLFP